MPALKLKKPRNRIFALTFALIILVYMVLRISREVPSSWLVGAHPAVQILIVMLLYSTLMIGYPIIIVGLLQEVRKPTLDFRPHHNWRWIATGIFLLGIFVVCNVYWWIACGIPNWLPQQGWQATVVESLYAFTVDTSSFALMFGILFMTRSTPQKSPSYRVILIGVVLFNVLLCMLTYVTSAFGASGGPTAGKNFWTEVVPTPWFWFDFLSELTILVGAVWLLRRGKK